MNCMVMIDDKIKALLTGMLLLTCLKHLSLVFCWWQVAKKLRKLRVERIRVRIRKGTTEGTVFLFKAQVIVLVMPKAFLVLSGIIQDHPRRPSNKSHDYHPMHACGSPFRFCTLGNASQTRQPVILAGEGNMALWQQWAAMVRFARALEQPERGRPGSTHDCGYIEIGCWGRENQRPDSEDNLLFDVILSTQAYGDDNEPTLHAQAVMRLFTEEAARWCSRSCMQE